MPLRPSALMRHRLSRALRLILPLGGLGLLSTVFMLSDNIDPSRAVDLSDLELTEIAREPRIGTARLAGVTADQSELSVVAASVRSPVDPQASDPIQLFLEHPDGTARFIDSSYIDFRAKSGQIDEQARILTLSEAVWLKSSNGYQLDMERLVVQFDRTNMRATGGVFGHGPAGEIQSDTLDITAIDDEQGGYLLDFRGDVRLIYQPQH
ncbi:MAG: hypothetical protein JJT99_06225 [Rhodobacteraceae bacterium]|nr:hypothetical protein [Paracoccaceae bacterium]